MMQNELVVRQKLMEYQLRSKTEKDLNFDFAIALLKWILMEV